MPLISTNDPNLHKKLKVWVAQRPGQTIGKVVETFIEFGLNLNVGDLSEEEREALAEQIKRLKGN